MFEMSFENFGNLEKVLAYLHEEERNYEENPGRTSHLAEYQAHSRNGSRQNGRRGTSAARGLGIARLVKTGRANQGGIHAYNFSLSRDHGVARLCGRARAEPCPFEKHQVTLQGTIVQSAFFRTPYMALVVEHPACDDETMVGVDAPKKWLGHHVIITGDLGAMADREWFSLTIKSIKDAAP